MEIQLPTGELLKNHVPLAAHSNAAAVAYLQWLADGQESSYTLTPNTGSLAGSNTNSKVGFGVTVSVSAGIATLSGDALNFGFAWTYEVVEVDGKKVIYLKVLVNTPGEVYNHDILITPELIGLDAYDAAYRMVTGQYNFNAGDRLIRAAGLSGGTGSGSWYGRFLNYYVTIADTEYPDF